MIVAFGSGRSRLVGLSDGSIQVDRRSANRRIRIESLRRDQQAAVKRAELLTFIRKRTITLGATLHTNGPLKRESDSI